MPTYEYECKVCGQRLEVFQKMSDPALKTCPECGQELRRLINGGSGIIFKGPGFYVTDNAAKAGKSAVSGTTPLSAKNSADHKSAANQSQTSQGVSTSTSGEASQSNSSHS